MRITCVKNTGKTQVFWLHSKDGDFFLGEVKWHGAWRKYAFFPARDTLFKKQCLTDIVTFLDDLMTERKINNNHGKEKETEK